MQAIDRHMKRTCPGCGSAALHTCGEDQLCLDCDWMNAGLLVGLGRMDDPFRAAIRHFSESAPAASPPAEARRRPRTPGTGTAA